MAVELNESRPLKHNKAFYPTLIEIQNMIQQAEAGIEAGIFTRLPKVTHFIYVLIETHFETLPLHRVVSISSY